MGGSEAYNITWLKAGILSLLIDADNSDLAAKTLAQLSAAFYIEGFAFADGAVLLKAPGYI